MKKLYKKVQLHLKKFEFQRYAAITQQLKLILAAIIT